MNKILVSVLVGMAILLPGCGTSSTDPLALMNNSFPPLNSILEPSVSFTALNTPYSQTNGTPYWTFAAWGAVNYVAPAAGIVSESGVDATTSANYIVILHSGRLATKIVGLNVALVRSGDSVIAGQIVGVFSNIPVQFQVFVDGAPVCPLSYMSQTFRASFFSVVFNSNPCRD